MSKAKSKDKAKELSYNRKWEKDRRDRINESFSKLGKLLPCYDPSTTLSKVEILTRAANFIEELHGKLKTALTGDSLNKPEQAEIKQLYLRIKQLLDRNEQLSNLLKDAGITIPSEHGVLKLCRPKKWSHKITPEKAKILEKEEAQKENEPKKPVNKPKPKKKPTGNVKTKVKKISKKTAKLIATNGNTIKLNSNIVQPCYFITNTVPTTISVSKTSTVVTNSTLLSAPILSTAIKNTTVVSQNNSIPSGTIIFANNLPVVQPPTLLNPPIILNTPPSNTLIVVKNTTSVTSVNNTSVVSKTVKPGVKTLMPIRPNITRTTHVNKVPIPASRYASNYILLSNIPSALNKVKVKRKVVKKVKVKQKPTQENAIQEQSNQDANVNVEVSDNQGESAAVSDKTNEIKSTKASDYSIDALCKEKVLITQDQVENKEIIDEKVVQEEESITPVIEELKVASKEIPTNIEEKQPDEPVIHNTNEKNCEEVANKTLDVLTNPLEHSELSNDIFASLQVPSGGQNPESTSPTAAFLNAFPLVSSFTGVKVTEVIEEETSDSPHGTPTLLQIGTIETSKPTQTDNLTPSLLNLDNFSFFSSKEMCNSLYNSYDIVTTTASVINKPSKDINVITKTAKILYDNAISDTDCLKQCNEDIKTTLSVSTIITSTLSNVTISKAQSEKKAQTTSIYTAYSQTYYDNAPIVNAPPAPASAAVDSFITDVNKPKSSENKNASCNRYNSTYNAPEYNTFNPFTDIPKSTTTCSYIPMKNYNQSVYTNNSCNYNYQPDFNTNYTAKNLGKNYGMNYENYDPNTNPNQYNYYNAPPPQLKPNEKSKTSDSVPRPPINWMTTPDVKQQNADFVVPQFSKETEFAYTQNSFVSNTQTTYFNTSAPIYSSTEFHNTFSDGKKLDTQFNNTFQRNDVEEHQFTWSPTKLPQLLDPPHGFVTNTLPTLVGDLALGTNSQYVDKSKVKSKERRVNQTNYDGTSNFLSVSQLVDHNKPETGRIASRRNSGGRSKTSTTKSCKRVNKSDNKDAMINQNYKVNEKTQIKNMQSGFNEPPNEWMPEAKRIKHPPSSYSAESLIGHPTQTGNLINKQRTQHQTFSKSLPVPSFLPDNLITYFPPVDIQQEPTFSQPNQNYQNNTFTHSFPSSIQSNTYTGTFMPNPTTSYLSSSNFMPEIADYNPIITENIFSHSNTKPNDNKSYKNQPKTAVNKQNLNNTTTPKKAKKKSANENAPGFVDFGFLSMPGTINSPILPDDFHSHSNFLPPPPNPNQLYSCKNPLYPKQSTDLGSSLLPLPVTRTSIQHPEISPSLNTVGSSLTNFNLSTIFPEINKSTVTDTYLDSTKNKDYTLQRSYLSVTTQIPFSKPPIYNSITTQSFTNS